MYGIRSTCVQHQRVCRVQNEKYLCPEVEENLCNEAEVQKQIYVGYSGMEAEVLWAES